MISNPNFDALYHNYLAHEAFWQSEIPRLNRLYQDDLRDAYKAAFPRRRCVEPLQPRKVLQIPNYEALKDSWEVFAECFFAIRKAALAHFEALFTEAAPLEPIPQTDDLIKLDRVGSHSYASQGFGANKYARESAQARADKATRYGLKAEVRVIDSRQVPTYPVGSMLCEDYGVFVNTTEIGYAQLDAMPDLSLRDCVKSCWKRGVNPRVYNPFLPHDFEEKHGLDYFGGELPAKVAA